MNHIIKKPKYTIGYVIEIALCRHRPQFKVVAAYNGVGQKDVPTYDLVPLRACEHVRTNLWRNAHEHWFDSAPALISLAAQLDG